MCGCRASPGLAPASSSRCHPPGHRCRNDEGPHRRRRARPAPAGPVAARARWPPGRAGLRRSGALDRLEADPPELLLLDLRMPRLSGWEVLETLRADGRIERLPVIELSAHADPSSATRALGMPCRGRLQKPFTEETLLD
ncbi:MAG: response regulator [Actinomycetota bacterium]